MMKKRHRIAESRNLPENLCNESWPKVLVSDE
jgi:hypothetical protein